MTQTRDPKTGQLFYGGGPIDAGLAFGPIYQDSTYKYFGEALSGTALTDASWRVQRLTLATTQIEWADGNTNFDNVFTDLSTVAALSYS